MNNALNDKRKAKKLEGIYTVLNVGTNSPLILDSPHSGHVMPDDFDPIVSAHDLRHMEDIDMDILLEPAIRQNNIPFLKAEFPRSYIDANRAMDDLDEELIEGDWPHRVNATSRSHNGIGLIRRLCKQDMPLYDRKLSVEEIEHRIENYYKPYHAQLKDMLDRALNFYGQVWHINCHSMPSSSAPVSAAGPIAHPMLAKADIVLGDRDSVSADLEFTHFVKDTLKNLGFRVVLNNPYKGLEIVKRSGNPYENRHSIQLEINRAIYVNEKTHEHTKAFGEIQEKMVELLKQVSGFTQSKLVDLAAD